MDESLNSQHPNRKRTIAFYSITGALCGGIVTERVVYAINDQNFQDSLSFGVVVGVISGISAGIYAAIETRSR